MRTKVRHTTAKQRARMIALRRRGVSLRGIARRTGFSLTAVHNITIDVKHGFPRTTADQRARMVQLRSEGLSFRQIAARLGFTFATVRYHAG